MKIDWKKKLTSRKLWTAVVGVVVGLAAAFGLKENEWAQVAGIITSAVSVFAYVFGEAKIDAESAGSINDPIINFLNKQLSTLNFIPEKIDEEDNNEEKTEEE